MKLHHLLEQIVQEDLLHAKLLNSLSYMENAGARKISACEHPYQVGIIQLKHAAEEHRHAYYLKKQINKLPSQIGDSYQATYLLAPITTKNYLQQLDIYTCRFFKNKLGLNGKELKYIAYLYVTYAIELRADSLYPIYQQILDKHRHKVNVKSIILEEEGHLEEMILQLNQFSVHWEDYASSILSFEEQLFNEWIKALTKEIQ